MYCFGTNGEGNGQFNAPTGVAVDKNDNIIVADWGNSRIQVRIIENLIRPHCNAVKHLYTSLTYILLQVFDSQGSFMSYVSTSVEPLYGPQGLTVTSDGYIAIADSGNHCIKLYKFI